MERSSLLDRDTRHLFAQHVLRQVDLASLDRPATLIERLHSSTSYKADIAFDDASRRVLNYDTAPAPMQGGLIFVDSSTATPAQPQLDPAKVRNYVARLRDAQNLGLGLAGGAIGAVIGAGIWAAITAATHFQIGWMAVGVGFLTGFGVRTLGKGIDPIFGYVGAALSLVGCAAGNILAVMIYVASHEHIAFSAIASRITPDIAWRMLTAGFGPIDVLFYGLGLYYGYRSSFHRISKEELAALS